MLDGGYSAGFVGVGAVAGDGGAVVAEVDVGLVAGDTLTGDAGAFEATDELFGFAGEHGTDDYFDAADFCAASFGSGGFGAAGGGWGHCLGLCFWGMWLS